MSRWGAPAPPGADEEEEEVVEKVGLNHVAAGKRNLLTQRGTQEEIEQMTGARVVSRGMYRGVDAEVKVGDEAIHLRISGASLSIVQAAVNMVREIIMSDEGDARRYEHKEELQGLPGAEHPFGVVARLVGAGGENVAHIRRTSNSDVDVCGIGCGSPERETGEPLHFRIQAHTQDSLTRALKLVRDLVDVVRQQFQEWKVEHAEPPPKRAPVAPAPRSNVYVRPAAPPPPADRPVKIARTRPPPPPDKPGKPLKKKVKV